MPHSTHLDVCVKDIRCVNVYPIGNISGHHTGNGFITNIICDNLTITGNLTTKNLVVTGNASLGNVTVTGITRNIGNLYLTTVSASGYYYGDASKMDLGDAGMSNVNGNTLITSNIQSYTQMGNPRVFEAPEGYSGGFTDGQNMYFVPSKETGSWIRRANVLTGNNDIIGGQLLGVAGSASCFGTRSQKYLPRPSVYTVGGWPGNVQTDGHLFSSSQFRLYDTKLNSWTYLKNYPSIYGTNQPGMELMFNSAGNITAAVVGGFGGGMYNSNATTLQTTAIYEIDTETWTIGANMPTARGGLCVEVIDDTKLFAIGGYPTGPNMEDSASSTCELFFEEAWSTKASMNTARSAAFSGVISGNIYVAGGWNTTQLDTVERYNPTTNTWTLIANATMPTARYNGASAVLNGKLFCFGGLQPDPVAYTKTSVVEAYDPVTNIWSAYEDIPSTEYPYGQSAATVEENVYVVGGGDNHQFAYGNVTVSTVVSFSEFFSGDLLKISPETFKSSKTLVLPQTTNFGGFWSAYDNTPLELSAVGCIKGARLATELPGTVGSSALYYIMGGVTGAPSTPVSTDKTYLVYPKVPPNVVPTNPNLYTEVGSIPTGHGGIARGGFVTQSDYNVRNSSVVGFYIGGSDYSWSIFHSNVYAFFSVLENPTANAYWDNTGLNMSPGRAGFGCCPGYRTVNDAISYFNTIYCIGGRTASGNTNLNQSFYRGASKFPKWMTHAPIPTSRCNPFCESVLGAYPVGKIYVAGGHNDSGISDKLEVYDIQGNAWRTLAKMPYAREAGTSGIIDNQLYCVGGRSDLNDEYSGTDIIQVYDINGNIWYAPVFQECPLKFYGAFGGQFIPVEKDAGANEYQMNVVGGMGIATHETLNTSFLFTFTDYVIPYPERTGFYGGFTDGRYSYLVPNKKNTLVRIDLQNFSGTGISELKVGLDGHRGGFTDLSKGYLIPYDTNGSNQPSWNQFLDFSGLYWSNNPWTVGFQWSAATASGNVMYVAGGAKGVFVSNCEATQAVWKYSTVNNLWSNVAPLPENRVGGMFTTTLVGKHWFFGGWSIVPSPDYVTKQNTVWYYTGNTWSTGPVGGGTWTPMLDYASQAGVVSIDTRVFIFGGGVALDGTKLDGWPAASADGFGIKTQICNTYDLTQITWSYGTDMPEARTMCAAALLNGKVYIAGGFGLSGVDVIVKDDLWEYDVDDNLWAIKTSMPAARSAGIMQAVGNRLIYIGGNESDSNWEPTSTIFVYNPDLDGWNAVVPYGSIFQPDASQWIGASSAEIGGTIYITGNRLIFTDNPLYSYEPSAGIQKQLVGLQISSTRPKTGVMTRFDLDTFTLPVVSTVDFAQYDLDLKGFTGGFVQGNYGYLVPNENDDGYFGLFARINLNNFTTDGIESLDLTNSVWGGDPTLIGFGGGCTDGRFAYLAPYSNGMMVRVFLRKFAKETGSRPPETVDYFNLGSLDIELTKFIGCFIDGAFIYLVPSVYGKVARVSISNFSTSGVVILNLLTSPGGASVMKGYIGGFIDGNFGYLVPNNYGVGALSGTMNKIVRINIDRSQGIPLLTGGGL